MPVIDIVILAVIAWQIWRGFQKGLISSIIGTVGWFVVLLVSIKFSAVLASLFGQIVKNPVLENALSFIVLIILMLTILWGIEKTLKAVFENGVLSVVERRGGGVFGAVKGVLIVLLAMGIAAPLLTKWQGLSASNLAKALFEYAPSTLKMSKEVAGEAIDLLDASDDDPTLWKDAKDTENAEKKAHTHVP